MATLTVQEYDRDGLVPTYTSCSAGGDSFANNGDTFIHVKNASVADITVTIATQKTVDGLAVADLAVVVGDASEAIIGPFPTAIYSTTAGLVNITYSGVTTLTIAAIQKA